MALNIRHISLTALAIALAAICTNGYAQTESTDNDYTLDNKPKSTFYKVPDGEKEDNNVYTEVDKKPEFPGGYQALYKFIADHLKYPEMSKMKRIQGKVLVRFIVGKQGEVENPEIVKGVAPDLDAEAIRVVKSLPKWIPGSHKGKNVRVESTVSVNFKLDEQPIVNEMPKSPDDDDNQIFLFVEKMPEFPGATDIFAVSKFLSENIKYPDEAKAKGLSGTVFVQFVVTKEGNVANIKIARGVDPLLDAEAIRVVKNMPKWKPGAQSKRINGEKVWIPVNVSHTVPVKFTL